MLVDYVLDDSGALIIDYTWKMNLSCFMSRDSTASRALHVTPLRKTVLYMEEKTVFTLNMTFYTDASYTEELTESPVFVDLGSILHVEVNQVKLRIYFGVFYARFFST